MSDVGGFLGKPRDLAAAIEAGRPENVALEQLHILIAEFEGRLDDEHELGAHLANVEVPFHLREVKRRGVLLLFEGVDRTGQDVLAIQHYGQLSLQLVKVKKLKDRPARVGFLADAS